MKNSSIYVVVELRVGELSRLHSIFNNSDSISLQEGLSEQFPDGDVCFTSRAEGKYNCFEIKERLDPLDYDSEDVYFERLVALGDGDNHFFCVASIEIPEYTKMVHTDGTIKMIKRFV